jgi:hypothetical protein
MNGASPARQRRWAIAQKRMANVIPTRPGLLARARRWALARWLTWQADCIRAERKQYEAAGTVGPIYLRNSLVAQMRCLRKARLLELSK